MIDLAPHAKAIETIDALMHAWVKSGGDDKGAKKAVEEFTATDDWYAIPYQHRNLYFVTASKLRSYQFLPAEAYKRYIECIDLPWLDKDYFIIGRAFDDRITKGEAWYADHYVCVNTRVDDVAGRITELEAQLLEYQNDLKKDGTRSQTGIKGEMSTLERMGAMRNLLGKKQLTQAQWKQVHNMTEEYRKHTMFPQEPKKLNMIWLAFGKVPCKGELDHWDAETPRIWDIKTTAQLTNFNPRQYLLQMGFYFMGIQEELMLRPDAALAVVDKGADFSRGCPFGFKVEDLIGMQHTINDLITRWCDSMQTQSWPDAGANELSALKVYWDSDYYPLLENSRPTQLIYV